MFTSMSGERHLPGGQSSSSPTRPGGTSPGLDSQESSWIGLLSVVSRPAVSFLQRYLLGRPRAPALCDGGAGWTSGDLKTSFVDEESEFLRQLDDMVPAPHLTHLRCRQAALLEPAGGGPLQRLSADSLREIGIQSAEELDLNLCQRTPMGYFPPGTTFLGHVRWSSASSQEIRKDWASSSVKSSGGKDRTWWGSFWGGEGGSQKELSSDVSWAGGGAQTKAAGTTALFVQSGASTLGENTGPTGHKEEPEVQNRGGGAAGRWISIRNHLSVALLPEQDNGYSSLEEEQLQMCHLFMLKAPREEPETDVEGGGALEEAEEDEEGREAAAPEALLAPPHCRNKAISFIMGCPCSDDDSSQSDAESSDEDDDGFDSEGSSDPSSEEDEGSDSEQDEEAERLWSSLCRSLDPYNPRNFTARLHTSSTPPRPIPSSTPPSSSQSTPAASPPLAASSSPPSGHDTWDDSTSASEVDEAESLHLWSSFSCSSDPYSPLNFQAPLRTRVEAGPRASIKTTPPLSPHRHPASPPKYRKEEAEERLDSGFSEPSTSTSQSCSAAKKVRFCDDVEEFFASCGEEEEDRRGPWEELARDRCRFLRRCQDVEQSIAYCLQPQHRSLVSRRLQDA